MNYLFDSKLLAFKLCDPDRVELCCNIKLRRLLIDGSGAIYGVLIWVFDNVSKEQKQYTKYLSKTKRQPNDDNDFDDNDNDNDDNYNYYNDEDVLLIQVKIDQNQQFKIEATQTNHRLPDKLQQAITKRATLLLASLFAQQYPLQLQTITNVIDTPEQQQHQQSMNLNDWVKNTLDCEKLQFTETLHGFVVRDINFQRDLPNGDDVDLTLEAIERSSAEHEMHRLYLRIYEN